MKRMYLVLSLLLFWTIPSAAQDASTEYFRGINSYNTYEVGSFESVNLDNFNLSLHIPIVSYPQLGSLPNLQIVIGYEPNSWYSKEFLLPGGGNYWRWQPTSFNAKGPYIYSNIAYVAGTRTYASPGLPTDYDNYIQGPDLSIHNLGSLSSTTLRAIDGTGWLSNTSGLLDKNGIVFGSSLLGTATDPQGNAIVVDPYGNNLIDSVGRYIPMPPNPLTSSFTLDFPGVNGGTYPVTFTYADYSIASDFEDGSTLEYSGSYSYLQSISLPNGTSWTFTYNGWGDLASVTTPTGGSVSYTWTYALLNSCCSDFSRVLVTRSVNANDGAGAKTWTYGQVRPGGTGTTAYPGLIDPDGNITAYTTEVCPTSCIPATKQYYQFTSAGAAQTLLKTENTYYTWADSPFNAYDLSPSVINLLPQYTTTSYPDGGSSQFIQTSLTYDSGATFYDRNLTPGGSNSYPLSLVQIRV